jgi:glutamate synthase (NADPH/NADH) large chain
VSLSSRTLVYKGMFLSYQLKAYYPDLLRRAPRSAMALVHQRFSTNTFPSWKLAHPYRMVAHNGEINTLRGNVNWMAARQASVSSPLFGSDITKLWPISYEGQSDTACFDNALEFLVMGGYSLAHAAMMLIPEAWAGNPLMDGKRRAFYEYHACLMEPWDGPAAMAFTDGRCIGATLDRNGLRPARYLVTKDDRVIMSSEAGVLPVPRRTSPQVALQPGKMLLIDLEQGKIVSDDDLKADLRLALPLRAVAEAHAGSGRRPAAAQEDRRKKTNVALLDLQQAFGYTQESLKFLMAPMAHTGQEAVGLDGQRHAGVGAVQQAEAAAHLLQAELRAGDEPADRLDPRGAGHEPRLVHRAAAELLDLEGTPRSSGSRCISRSSPTRTWSASARSARQGQPVLLGDDRHHLLGREGRGRHVGSARRGVREAEEAVRSKEYNIFILSDRATGPDRIPIPSLLATSPCTIT